MSFKQAIKNFKMHWMKRKHKLIHSDFSMTVKVGQIVFIHKFLDQTYICIPIYSYQSRVAVYSGCYCSSELSGCSTRLVMLNDHEVAICFIAAIL